MFASRGLKVDNSHGPTFESSFGGIMFRGDPSESCHCEAEFGHISLPGSGCNAEGHRPWEIWRSLAARCVVLRELCCVLRVVCCVCFVFVCGTAWFCGEI